MLSQMREVVSKAESGLSVGAAPLAHRRLRRRAATLDPSCHGRSERGQRPAKAFELGAPDVSLNDVMVDMQKASIGFSTAIQVRNKLVAAYKEISSMAV